MKIISTVTELSQYLNEYNLFGQTGFVPTMGALHEGHISLVRRAANENKISIVSIFVNPRQFNDKSDFENYPSTLENDINLLQNAGCNILFNPKTSDIYENFETHITDLQGLDKLYEGEYRPGHFQGVVDIVYRLFELIKPKKAYFGEKDFQQLAIIKLMTKNANLPIEIISCEIIREESGLAMSSRNQRLSSDERILAANIYKIMKSYSNQAIAGEDAKKLSNEITTAIDNIEKLKTEYVVFCEPESLKPVYTFEKNSKVKLCVAVWCGKIRLIDNLSLHI